jgi:hypothetical protein
LNETDVLQNAIEDIIKSEREFRSHAEQVARDLRSILMELAYRLDGQRLENMRHDDPNVPLSWAPEQWKGFFDQIPLIKTGWVEKTSEPSTIKLQALGEEIENLKKIIDQLQKIPEKKQPIIPSQVVEPQTPPSQHQKPQDTSSHVVKEVSLVYQEIIPVLQKMEPKKLPEKYKSLFNGSEFLLRRQLMVLYLLASKGFSPRIEVDLIIAAAENIGARSSTVRRVVDNLVAGELVQSEILSIESPINTCLNLIRLAPKGIECCRELEWDTCESEWERIIRLKGKDDQRYILSIMLLAMHARVRSYQVNVLPEQMVYLGADILITGRDGEKYPTLLCTGDIPAIETMKEILQKAGKICACAMEPESRGRIVERCKEAGIILGGVMDLKTLINGLPNSQKPIPIMNVTQDCPLWGEQMII